MNILSIFNDVKRELYLATNEDYILETSLNIKEGLGDTVAVAYWLSNRIDVNSKLQTRAVSEEAVYKLFRHEFFHIITNRQHNWDMQHKKAYIDTILKYGYPEAIGVMKARLLK